MRKFLALFTLLASLLTFPALADWTGKDAAGSTVTFKNPGACTSVVCVPVVQIYDGTNVVTLTTVGADAVSNTLTGMPTYSRVLVYNGTTWDRWQGAVTATLAAETTKVIGTVRIASGGVASGAIASGAIASGAVASGAIASGAMVDLGAQADSVCGTSTGTCTLVALVKYLNTQAASIVTNTGAAIPAGSSLIGGVKIFDTAGTNQATVKAASTASATADTSLTVQLNPAQPNLTTPLNVTGSGSAGTAAAGVMTVQGIASMTKLLVTPDSVALPANQSVNVAQVAGTTATTGSGVMTAGTQRTALATDSPGIIALGPATPANSVPTVPAGFSFSNITTATTTTVKSGAGVLHTLTVNNLGTVASTTTVYDNTAASGTKIGTINTLAGQLSYIYDVTFATGLTIVTTGTVAPDITVSYR